MSHGFTKDYLVKATGDTEIFVNGVKQESTSGTEIDFTIPSGAKEFKLLLKQVSLSGTAHFGVQLGDSGGIETSGYEARSGSYTASGVVNVSLNTDMCTVRGNAAAAQTTGIIHGVLQDAATNTWIVSHSVMDTNAGSVSQGAAYKALSGELTTVRLLDTGTNTFDGGSVNIQYENPNLAVSGVESVAAGVTDVFVNGVKQASTSGTSIDFTVPSGIKEFKLGFAGISCDASTYFIVQLGDAGGIETSNYLGGYSNDVATTRINNTTGFKFTQTAAATVVHGMMSFALQDSATNTWVGGGTPRNTNNVGGHQCGGSKSLSGELTTVRITTDSGTANFDAGSINILYDNQDLDLGSGVISGGVVQTVHTQDGEQATGTTTMPDDDTVPQNTEGDQYLTASITPTDASNKLKIEVKMQVGHSASDTITAALFQDSTASALASGAHRINTAGIMGQLVFTHWMTAGTTSSTTFNVRAGNNAAGTLYFNGQSGGRTHGGSLASSITITEYKV